MHIPDWVPQNLFKVDHQSIQIDGQNIHYIDEGKGPTLLLLHGNPTWSFLYRNIIDKLKTDFRCVSLDYPGFGLSKASNDYDYLPYSHAKIVESFIKKLNLTDLTVMVQDWGGPIGLWVAGKNPERIKSLVIGNTWAWPVNGDPDFEPFSKLMGGSVGKFGIKNFNAFVNILIPLGTKKQKLSKEVMKAYKGPFKTRESRIPTYIFPREILSSKIFLSEVENGLSKLNNLPVLILWGDKDIAFKDKERKRFESIFTNHKTFILAGSGHYIQEDSPTEISEQIKKWSKG